MPQSRQYIRESNEYQKTRLRKYYESHLLRKGFLTTNQKKRILGLSRKERGTTDSDFWYRIRHGAWNAILDLQLISEIAVDEELKEIFQPLTMEDYTKADKGIHDRTDLKKLVSRILAFDQKTSDEHEKWKSQLAFDMVNESTIYFTQKKKLFTNLHQRIFQDVRDIISTTYYYQSSAESL